jgi:hypothetical protein
MYVMVYGNWVDALGSTREETLDDFVRRYPICDTFDGSWPEIYPCSPELYQRLQAQVGEGGFDAPCQIDPNGVAIPGEPWFVLRSDLIAQQITDHWGSKRQPSSAKSTSGNKPKRRR